MPSTIGRFDILRMLGKGAQGEVYLARDQQLGRQVAIKTLLPEAGGNNIGALLEEARIVSKLQHPNIVTLFDTGEHDGKPYLVYAFVEGQTLAQLIKRSTRLPQVKAAQILCNVLDAIDHAHGQGVIHLDLKPANLMIGENGQPQVMDFGIARTVTQESIKERSINGSPHYIAPEILYGKQPTPQADLFSLGVVLQELASGSPIVPGDSVKISERKTAVTPLDEALEAIIMKATAKKPEERYATAAAMKQALLEYLDPSRESLPDNHHGPTGSTLNFLLRRMRSKSDFPALSSTISEINRIVDNDSASTNLLTQCILQDFSLTNKLLKLVNTVTYSQFGGKVNTISKAVVILGFEKVRDVAMTLILFEFLQNKALAAQLKEDVLIAFFAGIVAAQFPAGDTVRNPEETMICSMFRNLGKLLTTFYFFEESQEIDRLVQQGTPEEKAAFKVLGIGYNELAIGIAKSWNFPPRLLAGMRKLDGEKITKPASELDMLAVTVNLANELCTLASKGNPSEKAKALKQLSKRYDSALAVTEPELQKAMEMGLADLSAHTGIISMDLANSGLMERLHAWVATGGGEAEEASAGTDGNLAGITQLDITQLDITQLDIEQGETGKPHDVEFILTEGIQEVTNTLVEDHKLNDIMQMVLEVMHRGMKFQRTLILVRDAKKREMAARFGFGKDSDAVLAKFRFSLDANQDVFNLAASKGMDLLIEDAGADNIAGRIPAWHAKAVSSRSFILLPVMLNGQAVGLFYADMEKPNAMKISPRQLSLLKTLRNQAVLAIKQKN